ncbi:hypothetical protein EV193_106364 [Herbihabitans rhizosphaerae]|uniref:WXG100 family type VII secretion target n=1 Tax=Herbihabitans rhizosphaerae TaxID=1872711 RepID=A0A4Q7KLI3_9PSEU|nr:hypothetical protein [Herbihabitans rhizosphaerae]RZS37126.1 hypothetical protein EV193_106364 [Herbihabitans rhizosphaerae]
MGFEVDPQAVRGFAEVFNQAKVQVEQIEGTVADTAAKAPDFGNSWHAEGQEFEAGMKMLSQDLGRLAANFGNLHANLLQGTDVIVHADSAANQNVKAINMQLPGGR